MGEIESTTRDDAGMADGRPSAAGLRAGELPALVASLPRLTPAEADAFARDVELAREDVGEGRPLSG